MSALTDPDAPVPPAGPPAAGPLARQWTMTRHADVTAVLRSADFAPVDLVDRVGRIGRRAGRDYANLSAALRSTMVFQHGEPHLRSRKVTARFVTATQADWPGSRLRTEAAALVAGLPGGDVEAVASLANPLPTRVLAERLGMDEATCARLREMARSVTGAWLLSAALRDFDACEATSARLRSALCPFAGEGTRIGALTSGHADDDPIGLASFLLLAAAESIAGTIAAALDLLAREGSLQERVRAEPALVPGLVRETLRLAGPLRRLNWRVARVDAAIGDVVIRAGEVVVVRIDSAHRDPAVFVDPHRLDPVRPPDGLLAFGAGAHRCQGSHLGALEAEAVVGAVLERFRVRPGPERGRLVAHEDWRLFEALPLRLEPLPPPLREAPNP